MAAMLTPTSKASIWDAIANDPSDVVASSAPTDVAASPMRQWSSSSAPASSPGAIDRHYADTRRALRLAELRNIRLAANETVARTRVSSSSASPGQGASAAQASPPVSPDDVDLTPASPTSLPASPLQQTTSPRATAPQRTLVTIAQLEASLQHEITSRVAMAEKLQGVERELETARAGCTKLEQSLREANDNAAAQADNVSVLTLQISEFRAASQASEAKATAAEVQAAQATSHLERRCKQLEEKLSSHDQLIAAHSASEKRCESLETELADLRTDLGTRAAADVERRVAAQREHLEKAQRSMQQSVVALSKAETELRDKTAALALAHKEIIRLRALVQKYAPANQHFGRWNIARQQEEEQCLVRKLQQALVTSNRRRTLSAASHEPGSELRSVTSRLFEPEPEPEPEQEAAGSPVLLAELLTPEINENGTNCAAPAATASLGALPVRTGLPQAAAVSLTLEQSEQVQTVASEPGAHNAAQRDYNDEAHGVQELLDAAEELQHVVAAEREQHAAEREQHRIEHCQLVAALGASVGRYDALAMRPAVDSVAVAMASAAAVRNAAGPRAALFGYFGSPQRVGQTAEFEYGATLHHDEQHYRRSPPPPPPQRQQQQQQQQQRVPPHTMVPSTQMPSSLPPPARGLAARRLFEEANVLRRMARLHSPGLARTHSPEKLTRFHAYHGSDTAHATAETTHYAQTRTEFHEQQGYINDEDDGDEQDELGPRTPERHARQDGGGSPAPLSPALAAARKLLRDMGARYDATEAKPPGSPMAGEEEEFLWPGKLFDELSASETKSTLQSGVVGDSPQRELATIRQQIKSMQAARKTRASVLHGVTAHRGRDVGA